MHPSRRRTFESSPITPLVLTAVLCGLAADAHAVTPLRAQEAGPQSKWREVMGGFFSAESLAEIEILCHTDGEAALLKHLDFMREGLNRLAKEEIEASRLTPDSAEFRTIEKELAAALARLATIEQALIGANDPSKPDAEQAARTAESDRVEIRRVVENALITFDESTLGQFGSAIEDILAELALESAHPVALVRWKYPLLLKLAQVSPQRTFEVALELVNRPGRGWAAAVCTSLREPWDVFENFGRLRLADGTPAPAPFDLALRLLASDEVSAEARAMIAAPFLLAGIEDPRLYEAAERVLPEVQDVTRFQRRELETWHMRLLASGITEQRVAGASGRLKYADVDDLGLLERLLQDPAPEVRAVVAERLPSVFPEKVAASPEYTALWMRALSDPSDSVRRAAYTALQTRVQTPATLPLNARATAALIVALEDPAEAAPGAALVADLKPLIRALPRVATSSSELGAVYATLLQSKLVDVPQRVVEMAQSTEPHEVYTALLESLGEVSSEISERLASTLNTYGRLNQAPAEACLRAFAHLVQLPQQPKALVELTRKAFEEKSRKLSLDSLPPEEAVEVLLRSVEAAPGLVPSFLLNSDWQRCAALLSTEAADAERSPQERTLATLALERARPLAQTSIAALVESISACFQGDRDLGERTPYIVWAAIALDDEPSALNSLLLALLGRPEIPTAAFNFVTWSGRHAEALSRDELGVLFDALERRAASHPSGPQPFWGFAQAALAAMQRDSNLVRKALFLGWSESNIASATAVAQRSPDRDIANALRGRFLAKLDSGIDDTQMTALISALIHLEGPRSAADYVAERAATLGKPKLVTIATELLESSAKLREVGARLANAGGGVSRDSAVIEVVGLLDAPDEAVRIEAIRGLSTLGAVEQLPRLIRIVGKGTPAERAAARAALDDLHQRAAKEPQQAAPAQTPPKQDQAGGEEAPR